MSAVCLGQPWRWQVWRAVKTITVHCTVYLMMRSQGARLRLVGVWLGLETVIANLLSDVPVVKISRSGDHPRLHSREVT